MKIISFEVNQQVGKKIEKNFWSKILKKIQKELKINTSGQISLAIVSGPEIKKLNLAYRGKNKVTDVLSFSEIKIKDKKFDSKAGQYWGEIIICYPQAQKQAKENKKTLKQELELLFVHGLLHLLGYDHEKKNEEKKMRSLEQKIVG